MTVEADLMIDAPTTTSRRGYDRDEVDSFVEATRQRLQAMAERLGQQQAEVERLASENRSYTRAIDIAMKAAGEVMEEATTAAESTIAEAESRAASIVATAEQRAATLLEAADTEARERVEVGRADAAAAVRDERIRVDAELEMIEALQRKSAKERQSLVALRDQLSARLLEAGRYLTSLAEDPLRAGQELIEEALALAAEPPSPGPDPTVPTEESAGATVPGADVDDAEESSEFFSDEIEDDPSRAWILS